jgi:hypothetical protein
MATIQFDDDTARRAAALAEAAGMTVEAYLTSLIQNQTGSMNKATLTADEFMAQVEALSIDGPTLPADFSRADLYFDHD